MNLAIMLESCLVVLILTACAANASPVTPTRAQTSQGQPSPTTTSLPDATLAPATQPATPSSQGRGDLSAEVLSVEVLGEPGAYQFTVTVRSPDEGCQHYADWWEVLSTEGDLLYRRILLHSHVDEQPFARSGGPVPIQSNTIVIVRVHMHPEGYGGTSYRGSVAAGFTPLELKSDFAMGAAQVPPLPESCAF